MGDQTLTREQALLVLHDHFGEQCMFALYAEVPDAAGGVVEVLEFHGELRHALGAEDAADASADVRDAMGTLYAIGGQTFTLPALPGTITQSGDGLSFLLADGLVLRVAWQAPGEQGELGSS